MKLNSKFVLTEMLDMNLAVPVRSGMNDFNGVINLNETARRVFELIQDERTPNEIVSIMMAEYDVTEEEMQNEVAKVINALDENNLLIR